MICYQLGQETPSKKNNRIFNSKTHRMFPSERYKSWHEYAALMLKRKITECIKDRCYIILVFCHSDNRRRDSDNGVNSIFDMLVDLKALEDDRWQIVRNHHVFNTYEKGNPWCKVFIFKPDEKELYKQYLIELVNLYE